MIMQQLQLSDKRAAMVVERDLFSARLFPKIGRMGGSIRLNTEMLCRGLGQYQEMPVETLARSHVSGSVRLFSWRSREAVVNEMRGGRRRTGDGLRHRQELEALQLSALKELRVSCCIRKQVRESFVMLS